MKKLILLLSVLFLKLNAFTQEESSIEETTDEISEVNNQLLFGMTFAPFASNNFDGSEAPFDYGTTLFTGLTYAHNSWALAPYYNFGTNGAGMFLMVTFSSGRESVEIIEKSHTSRSGFGTYTVVEKSASSSGGVSLYGVVERYLTQGINYHALGLTTSLYKGYVLGYVEMGSLSGPGQDPTKPILGTGLYMSFNALLGQW